MESHFDVYFDTLVARWFTAQNRSGRASRAAQSTCTSMMHATDANLPSSATELPSALADFPRDNSGFGGLVRLSFPSVGKLVN